MENIQFLVNRVLKQSKQEKGTACPEEKEYQFFWEKQVPRRVQKHCRFFCKKGEGVVLVDNAAAQHFLFLQKEKLQEAFQKARLPINKLTITTAKKPLS